MVEAIPRGRNGRFLIGCRACPRRRRRSTRVFPGACRLFATPPLPPALWALLTFAAWSLGSATYCYVLQLPFWLNFAEIDLLQISIIAITPRRDDLGAARSRARSPRSAAAAERRLRPDRHRLGSVLLPRTADARVDRRRRRRDRARPAVLAGELAGRQARHRPSELRVGARCAASALGWLVGRTVGIELAVAWGFAKLGERGVEVDWLEQRPLAPFARKGLRSVFLLLLYSVLFSLFLLEPWGKIVAIPMLVLFPALCVAALLLPVSGVHRRLVAAKQAELARVDAALRAEAEANLKPGARRRRAAGARLSNLVAYRGLLDAAGTWPFDLAIWLRFFVYVTPRPRLLAGRRAGRAAGGQGARLRRATSAPRRWARTPDHPRDEDELER